jgi:hypothetical protein
VWLVQLEARLRIKAVTELRLQINPNRFRIPDLMVLSSDAPREQQAGFCAPATLKCRSLEC